MASKESYEDCVKLLEKFSMNKLWGINYMKWMVPDMEKQVERMQALEVKDGDVYTIGYPRSGNHWTFEVVSMILGQNTDFRKEHFIAQLLEIVVESQKEQIDNMPAPRHLNTHFRPRCLPKQILDKNKKAKVIYIMRNVKDSLVSIFHYFKKFKQEFDFFNFDGTFDDYLRLQLKGDFPYGTWFEHVLSVEEFMNEHPEIPVYVLLYENMKKTPEAEMRKLCQFLEVSEDIAPAVAEQTKFDKMGKDAKYVEIDDMYKAEKQQYLRKGQIGSWKDFLTVAQSEMIDQAFEKHMAGSKLGDLVREYI